MANQVQVNSTGSAWTLTKAFHRAPYAAISPQRAALSQVGRTVLITGGNSGIGYAIAKAFLAASARKVIITGRREGATLEAAKQLTAESAQVGAGAGFWGEAVGLVCDMADAKAVDGLWDELAREGKSVDVLVLNAVKVPEAKTLLETGAEGMWEFFDANVRAQVQMVERFSKQTTQTPKFVVNISTLAIHDHNVAGTRPAYGLTKSAAALAMQLIAQDTAPSTLQIVNMNPGGVLTQAAKIAGYTEDSYMWNSPDLPGRFAVWLASSEAAFLHGRFVWTEWDVEELKNGEVRRRIEENGGFLRVGVSGL